MMNRKRWQRGPWLIAQLRQAVSTSSLAGLAPIYLDSIETEDDRHDSPLMHSSYRKMGFGESVILTV